MSTRGDLIALRVRQQETFREGQSVCKPGKLIRLKLLRALYLSTMDVSHSRALLAPIMRAKTVLIY